MDSYEQLSMCHKKAFECISQALKIDEESQAITRKRKAADWYRKGIAELEKGISVNLNLISPTKSVRAEQLKEKMLRNLQMSQERLQALEEKVSNRIPKPNNSVARSSSAVGPARPKPPIPKVKLTVKNRLNPSVTSKSRSLSPKHPRKPLGQKEKDDITNRIKRAPNVDSKLGNTILDQVLETNPGVSFNDVCGLDNAKQALNEAVILPAINPQVFTGLRQPVKGLLLFGPPGNGKTMLAKAVAHEANSTFFNISAAALTSKWVGEAEKLVKTLFTMAREVQPAIIFIDEIDSILCTRSEKDNEVSRRLKTEFLLQFDGVGSDAEERILVMGATNRPSELDDAVIRRFPKRIYIGLPDRPARYTLLDKLMKKQKCPLKVTDLTKIVSLTDGYSNSDLTELAKEAAMGPIREVPPEKLKYINSEQLRPILVRDFEDALLRIKASTNREHIKKLEEFARNYGQID